MNARPSPRRQHRRTIDLLVRPLELKRSTNAKVEIDFFYPAQRCYRCKSKPDGMILPGPVCPSGWSHKLSKNWIAKPQPSKLERNPRAT